MLSIGGLDRHAILYLYSLLPNRRIMEELDGKQVAKSTVVHLLLNSGHGASPRTPAEIFSFRVQALAREKK